MLAVRYHGVGQVHVEDMSRPVCGPGQVLVKVVYAGICGSDLHIFRKGMFVSTIPEIMGHEFSGVVEQVGPKVITLQPGDQVVGDPRVSCGTCAWCRTGAYNLCPNLGFIGEVRPGCFAEYLVLNANKLIKVPASVPLRRAALVEPLAVALHIAGKGRLEQAEHLGIVGAGPIGILTVLVAQTMQVKRVTVIDIAEERLALAGRLGATVLSAFPAGQDDQPDVVVEAVGVEPTLAGALVWLRPRGRLVMAGLYEEKINIDPNDIVVKELELVGVSAYETADLQQAVELVAKGEMDVEQVVTHVLPLTSAPEAFALLASGDKKAGKILLTPREKGEENGPGR
ncbi:MAG: alcohol dehydrogenase catalytic domain-containing protein [Peptococcaceae bacterium]|nr:alcohol dehydrogenase catalytic domain-containing protein [Peptococcaceae bacterium]